MTDDEETRILVPLDGSEEAETILPALKAMVRIRPVELVLLGVVDSDWEGLKAKTYFDRLRKKLLLEGIRSVSLLSTGRPEEEILYWAREKRAGLIAMTTHGRTGIRRAVMGSVAESVLRQSSIPLIVNRPGSRIGDWKRLVVALDGSSAAEAVLPDAARIARATCGMVHAVSVHSLPGVYGFAGYVGSEDPLPYLNGIVSRMASQGVMTLPVVRKGFPAAQITEYASECGAGLVCITTLGRTGLARAVAGSVAEEVMRSSPCPVMVRRMVPAARVAEHATVDR